MMRGCTSMRKIASAWDVRHMQLKNIIALIRANVSMQSAAWVNGETAYYQKLLDEHLTLKPKLLDERLTLKPKSRRKFRR